MCSARCQGKIHNGSGGVNEPEWTPPSVTVRGEVRLYVFRFKFRKNLELPRSQAGEMPLIQFN